jgi:proline iminopeptidase
MRSAWDLKQKLVESELKIIPDAGHSAMEDGIISELVNATDRFSEL